MTLSGLEVRPVWVGIAAARTEPVDKPVRRRRIFIQVIVGAVLVILVVALIGVVAARRLAEAEAVNDAAKTANLLAEAVVQPVLTEGLLTGDATALAAVDRVVRQQVLGTSIARVKLWNPEGRILYSDEPLLIGRTFPLGADERDVLSNPTLRADVSDLQAPENVYEKANVRLLKVYRPVWTPSGRPMLFETYFRYDDVTARSGELWRGFAGITLSSILLLVLLLLPILWRLLDRLNRGQRQREALLQRAVDASNEERRRIAGTLHDGVVQDLVATSFAVAGSAELAAAQGREDLAADLRSSAGTVRTSIGGLRSLLVEIYPPNLTTAGLPAALADLAATLRSRGVEVSLHIAADLALRPDDERLIYRVAQECLNNVAKHAAAHQVAISIETDGRYTLLQIVDDGVGFDVPQSLADPEQGHFGLRVLADVAGAAGADLRLSSAVGAGTTWQLRLGRR
ncbi:signal transduction histidine kinase [Nakamurella sp. UYEF19]|uniref:sensor histidine kinase n=1 Tax=Nakamurella sp. UYEF19 TaxID=1756392 RepID=UPI003392CE43